MTSKIGAILVLYNPNWETTKIVIKSLTSQVDLLTIVDNTPDADHSSLLSSFKNTHYIPLKENIGIAAAQNIGIKYFINRGFDFVLFSDQDSVVPDNVVEELKRAHDILNELGIAIAAIGTRAINKQTGTPYPPKSKELGRVCELTDSSISDDLTECYSVISSVSLIPTKSLLSVGGFDESLFIDGVDHEWCWRAWHLHKLRSFIAEKAKIRHMLGEGDKKLGGRDIAIASSFRVYYQFRNYLWLCRRKSTPKFWKRKHLLKYAIKSVYFPLAVSPRITYLKNILRGIFDGLFNYNKNIKSWPDFQQKNV